MKKSVIIILALYAFTLNAQDRLFSVGIGYVLFGEGDYSGINYQNSFQFPILKDIDLKAGIQIANAAETRDEYYFDRHNVFNFANYYNISITPVKTKLFSASISAGGIWRYRSEIVFNNSKTLYTSGGRPVRVIENDYNKSFDIGYNVDITALIRVSERLNTGACGQYIGYNRGSGLFSINLCFSYRL